MDCINISILTVFSELYQPFLSTSLIQRARNNKLIDVSVEDFFSFVQPKERIDAPPFGPGAGMLIKPVVIERAVSACEQRSGKAFKIFFSPQGKKLDQNVIREIAHRTQETKNLMLIASRYEGIDARAEAVYADMIISLGDFVLMGADIAALALLEATLRYIPRIVGKTESVEDESFSGPFVEYPHYTEPVVWKGLQVPDILRSGNHAAIQSWRKHQAAQKTVLHHFKWLRSQSLSEDDRQVARQYIPHHYVALLHNDVLIGETKKCGTTSVTSIDIHDIARSCKTYLVEHFFVVTHLSDQQKIVQRLLDFWMAEGIEYNVSRHEAVKHVSIENTLNDVVSHITAIEGKKPLVIATSARDVTHEHVITFHDQEKIWVSERPVLFIFGTGRGLCQSCLDKADFLLTPIKSLSDYNHLSVRSAIAIVLDRWLGINL